MVHTPCCFEIHYSYSSLLPDKITVFPISTGMCHVQPNHLFNNRLNNRILKNTKCFFLKLLETLYLPLNKFTFIISTALNFGKANLYVVYKGSIRCHSLSERIHYRIPEYPAKPVTSFVIIFPVSFYPDFFGRTPLFELPNCRTCTTLADAQSLLHICKVFRHGTEVKICI